ncbi:site-specific integrase [Eubacteriales bacterium OttesenSCG-928-M02]|nr:site-specific integrase [Eubacteriales bacterium OttesenSCG-928-M02]
MAGRRANNTGCIRKLPNGRWEARITKGYGIDGKQQFQTFSGKDKKAVEKKLKDFIRLKEEGNLSYNNQMLLATWLDKWYETYVIPNVKKSTRASYEMIIRVHIKPFLGHTKLKDLRKGHIDEFYNYLVEHGNAKDSGGLSPKTVKNIHLVLRKALDEAMKSDLIAKNYAALANVPTMRSRRMHREKIDVLSKHEQLKLELACTNDGYGMAIKLALYTGMRLGEILGLQWQDIDFVDKTIAINKQLNRLPNFNPSIEAKTTLGLEYDTKTLHSNRKIPMAEKVVELLQNYKAWQEEEKAKWGEGYRDKDMVFARENGEYIDPATFRSRYIETEKRAGLEHIKFHALRHPYVKYRQKYFIPCRNKSRRGNYTSTFVSA